MPRRPAEGNVFRFYCMAVETLANVVLRSVPSVKTTAMMAIEMPAASKPYSIAVAPDRSAANRARS